MKESKKRQIVFWALSSLILLSGVYLAIVSGATDISVSQIVQGLLSHSDTLEITLIRDVRIPRVIAVLMTGGILGITGAMIQGVTRNPIAEPSLIGVSQGATFVVAVFFVAGIAVTTFHTMIAAFIGAAFSGSLVIIFLSNRKNRNSMTKILLAGTAISTLFISLTTIIGFLSNKAQFIAFWIAGGFRNVTWIDCYISIFFAATGLIFAFLMAKKINTLSLGDDIAIGLGENPGRIRLVVLLAMIVLSAVAVAIGKNIVFVGLIVPQISRKWLGEDYKVVLPASFILGALLLTYSDIAARLLLDPYEMPIGIFTAIIGVPFFLAVARKEKG
ncbi:MAG: FecCD family ABC transporter permease [Lachnospiraceae bacterium]